MGPEDDVERRSPRLPTVPRPLGFLPDIPALLPPAAAEKRGRAVLVTFCCSEHHPAVLHPAIEQEYRASIGHPALVPHAAPGVPRAEALSPQPVVLLIDLTQRAATHHAGDLIPRHDRIRCGHVVGVPVADP